MVSYVVAVHCAAVMCNKHIWSLISKWDFAYCLTAVMLPPGSPKMLCVSMLEISQMWS